jgi:hypothetical protein
VSSILIILLVPSCRVLWILELLPELDQYKILSPCQGEVLESLLEKHQEIIAPWVSLPSFIPFKATLLSMLGRLDILLEVIAWLVLLRLIVE